MIKDTLNKIADDIIFKNGNKKIKLIGKIIRIIKGPNIKIKNKDLNKENK